MLLIDDDFWEKESVFRKGVAPGGSTMLQGMASHSRVYRQHKLNSAGFSKVTKLGGGWAYGGWAWEESGRSQGEKQRMTIIKKVYTCVNSQIINKRLYFKKNSPS